MSNIKLGDYSKSQTGIVYNNVSTIQVKDKDGNDVEYYSLGEHLTEETFSTSDIKTYNEGAFNYIALKHIPLNISKISINSEPADDIDISNEWPKDTNIVIIDNINIPNDATIKISYSYKL